jgi:pyruvate,water dikinase
MIPTLKPLADITPADRDSVGGKAFNCARLRQAGFPVPDGIIVSTLASDAEIRQLPDDPWFDGMPAGTLFAVRSSGIGEDGEDHSFAGIHETHLNVPHKELVEAVLVCRRSAQSEQAMAYRRFRHLEGEGETIGVLVQRMVAARVSGVAFTVNPISGADEIVINAASGLGEALVSGQINPDEFTIRKRDGAVTGVRHGAGEGRTSLTPAQLADLGAILRRIEEHYGAPQDVEFCYDGRQFWIVQSRPITTGRSAQPRTGGAAAAGAGIARGDTEWTRANLAEVLPDQLAPQALDLYEGMLNDAERRFFGRLMAPESELGPIVKAFHGRLYFNLTQMRHVTSMARAAFADTLRSMGHSEAIRPEDEVPVRPPLAKTLRALPDFARLAYYALTARRVFQRHSAMTARALERLARDPRTMRDDEIWAAFEWWLDVIPQTLTAVFVMSSVQFREQALRDACRAAGFPYEQLVYPLLAAGERSVSSQQAYDLDALAAEARGEPAASAYLLADPGTFADYRERLAGTAFLSQFDAFLARYGHRGRYESDWSIPRLHEDPAPVLFAIRTQLRGEPRDLQDTARRQDAAAAASMQAIEARLTRWQRWTLLPRVRSTLRGLKQQYLWRERVRFDLTRVLSRLRAYHLVLADRFVERGSLDRRDDYFLLHLAEVRRAVKEPGFAANLRHIAAERGRRLDAERVLHMPLFMRESQLGQLMAPPIETADGAESWPGLCVSAGVVDAEVVVLRDPGEFAAMRPGAILVTHATDPSWTPLFTLAAGVVVEVGGMMSHASTIAREYGLPALANVKNATRILRTGDRVRLDATGGRLLRLGAGDPPAPPQAR